ncbi:hypothetical protein [Aquirufa antheringensis]|uniref:hypothetical protein n=1 Tax=Aquirufa antheringensis TaxID=2516559 RepID=UPI0022A8B632|nr:hypothetical protein [Aquirufa antheringensis]MCZ2487173.1 hypothetical protein [Aquirufa antheringensis]MCZ2489844.1 hypothetical protein [Aquirufa antheringensis]
MKSIRLKYCTDNGCTFRFVNRSNLHSVEVVEKKGSVSITLSLKTGESVSLLSGAETLDAFNQRWSRFEASEEIFFDLAEFEVIR